MMHQNQINRRQFLRSTLTGVGLVSVGGLFSGCTGAVSAIQPGSSVHHLFSQGVEKEQLLAKLSASKNDWQRAFRLMTRKSDYERGAFETRLTSRLNEAIHSTEVALSDVAKTDFNAKVDEAIQHSTFRRSELGEMEARILSEFERAKKIDEANVVLDIVSDVLDGKRWIVRDRFRAHNASHGGFVQHVQHELSELDPKSFAKGFSEQSTSMVAQGHAPLTCEVAGYECALASAAASAICIITGNTDECVAAAAVAAAICAAMCVACHCTGGGGGGGMIEP